MPLSAEERRQWRELERRLTSEVPTVAEPVRDRGIGRRTMGLAGAILALGIVLVAFFVVILAVLVKVLLLGVLGFVLMIVGGTRFQHPRRQGQPTEAAAPVSRHGV